MPKQNRLKIMLASLLSIAALLVPAVAAAQAVTQAYTAAGDLQQGMIVKLTDKDTSKVEVVTPATVTHMQGVVVAPNAAPVTLSPTTPAGQQVYVATSGKYKVLVSDQNGPIKSGDYISISSLAGVGMKADSSVSVVLGKATANLDNKTIIGSTNLSGSPQKVNLALVPVEIAISHNPLANGAANSPNEWLERTAETIANRHVNPVRLYTALAILVISLVVGVSILYSGIRSSLTSIGRNPLARASILRNLLVVVLSGLLVVVIGLGAVYLLLKL
jgi:hypothetical protein